MIKRLAVTVLAAALVGCSDNSNNVVVVTADHWQAAESWCSGMQGVQSVTARDYYYSCGRGYPWKIDYTHVNAQCKSGQIVSHKFQQKKGC